MLISSLQSRFRGFIPLPTDFFSKKSVVIYTSLAMFILTVHTIECAVLIGDS